MSVIGGVIKQAQQQAARTTTVVPAQFFLVPTCPPTTSATLRQGMIHRNATYWGFAYYDVQVPDMVIDFANTGDTMALEQDGLDLFTAAFDNAHYYVGIVFGFNYQWVQERTFDDPDIQPTFLYYGDDVEYATAPEAEEHIDWILNGGFEVSQWDRCSLWALVLKNNGTVDAPGQIEPIDPINRGRSYIYRDARERTFFAA